jgi:hypothetical protein
MFDSALSAPSNRSTIRVTITSTTTTTPVIDSTAGTASRPTVTVIETNYMAVTPRPTQPARSLPPHTVSNIPKITPIYDGILSVCVMICPSGFDLPSSPVAVANMSFSGPNSLPRNTNNKLNPICFVFIPEPQFNPVVSLITVSSRPATGTQICPNSMSHAVPGEATTGPYADALSSPARAISATDAVRFFIERRTRNAPLANDYISIGTVETKVSKTTDV